MRLDKYLCDTGKGSRKEIKQFIKDGKVSVNEKIIKKSDFQVDENNDCVVFCGETVYYKKFIYLMMNKPKGYISATEDKKLPVVSELVPDEFSHFGVFCAGRLDIDTTGFLLLTNDGTFAHNMMSPKHHIYKKYYAVIDKPVTEDDVIKIKEGITLDDGYKCMEATLEIIGKKGDGSEIFLTICEGKFHQVKRMFEAVGKKVLSLKRVSIGSLTLDPALAEGELREITDAELNLVLENQASE